MADKDDRCPVGLVKVNKLAAARRQLDTAIALWFHDGDPVSVLSLSYAAYEILHRLYRNAGFRGLLYDSQHMQEDQRSEFCRLIKSVPNFLKHANRSQGEDAEQWVTFPVTQGVAFMLFSIFALRKLVNPLNDVETAFHVWVRIQEPSWFIEDSAGDPFPVKAIQKYRNTKPAKFLEDFRKFMGS